MKRLALPAFLTAAGILACGGREREAKRIPVASFNDLAVYDAYSPAAPLHDVTSVYLTVVNIGSRPDTLRTVSTAIGTAHLHEVVTENDLTRMQPVESLTVPAQGELRLLPGGYHIMLSQMGTGIRVGDTIVVELEFARAGSHTIPVVVLTYSEVLQRLGVARNNRQ